MWERKAEDIHILPHPGHKGVANGELRKRGFKNIPLKKVGTIVMPTLHS